MQFTSGRARGSISGNNCSTRFADQRLKTPLRSSVGQTAKSTLPLALRMIVSSDGAVPASSRLRLNRPRRSFARPMRRAMMP